MIPVLAAITTKPGQRAPPSCGLSKRKFPPCSPSPAASSIGP
jgi:hypothetical protein